MKKRTVLIAFLLFFFSWGETWFSKFYIFSSPAIFISSAKAEENENIELARIAESITVRIEGATQGSGVLIKKDGNLYTVLTAWHVIKDNQPKEEVGIITVDGIEHLWNGYSIERLGKFDLALFTFKSQKEYQIAKIGDANSVFAGEKIFVAGFPLPSSSVPLNLFRFFKGEVVANSNVFVKDGYQLLYSNPTLAGMSGGPLLDLNGELVGIHGRAEREDQISNQFGKLIATGINQGIPILLYEQYLSGETFNFERKSINAGDYLVKASSILEDENGSKKEVIELINKSLKLEKSYYAYYLRGLTYSLLEMYENAISDFSKSIEIDPEIEESYVERANAKIQLRKYIDVLTDVNKGIQINPNNTLFYRLGGFAKYKLRDFTGAQSDLSKAIELTPNDPWNAYAFYYRGLSSFRVFQFFIAVNDLTKAIEIDPNYKLAYYYRSLTREKLQQYEGALSDMDKVIELSNNVEDENKEWYFAERARIKVELKDNLGAIKDLKTSIDINPNNANHYHNLGSSYQNLNQHEEAIIAFDTAILMENDPNILYHYLNNRAWSKYEIGNLKEGLIDINKSIQLNNQYPNSYDTRGHIKFQLKDFEGACNDMKKSISLGGVFSKEWFENEGKYCE